MPEGSYAVRPGTSNAWRYRGARGDAACACSSSTTTTRSSTTSSSTWASSAPSRSCTATTRSPSTRSWRSTPTRVLISPGPGRPEDAGISNAVIERFAGRVPDPRRLPRPPVHRPGLRRRRWCGRPRSCTARRRSSTTTATGVFAGLPDPFEATRYHSLVVDRDSRARRARGHRRDRRRHRSWACATASCAVEGVQFHPESILTGRPRLLRNFLAPGLSVATAGADGDRDRRARLRLGVRRGSWLTPADVLVAWVGSGVMSTPKPALCGRRSPGCVARHVGHRDVSGPVDTKIVTVSPVGLLAGGGIGGDDLAVGHGVGGLVSSSSGSRLAEEVGGRRPGLGRRRRAHGLGRVPDETMMVTVRALGGLVVGLGGLLDDVPAATRRRRATPGDGRRR